MSVRNDVIDILIREARPMTAGEICAIMYGTELTSVARRTRECCIRQALSHCIKWGDVTKESIDRRTYWSASQ